MDKLIKLRFGPFVSGQSYRYYIQMDAEYIEPIKNEKIQHLYRSRDRVQISEWTVGEMTQREHGHIKHQIELEFLSDHIRQLTDIMIRKGLRKAN